MVRGRGPYGGEMCMRRTVAYVIKPYLTEVRRAQLLSRAHSDTNSSFPLFDARRKGVEPYLFRAFTSMARLGINRVRLGYHSVAAGGIGR
jgi:hypothetical protein